MNYDDYYARQVGGALPYFTGARVQRGHGFRSLFSGLLRTVAPLIRRGAVALGKRALTTGAQIAGDVVAGKGGFTQPTLSAGTVSAVVCSQRRTNRARRLDGRQVT